MHWSEAWKQRDGEPLADYVRRLEGIKAGAPAITVVMGSVLNDMIRDARHRLRAIHDDLKKTPAIRRLDAAKSGRSPGLQEIMRLFPQITDDERQEFFLWYSGGMVSAGPRKKGAE